METNSDNAIRAGEPAIEHKQNTDKQRQSRPPTIRRPITRTLVCLAIAIPMLLCGGFVFLETKPFHPARRSDEVIRGEILLQTPLGSTKQEVEDFARSKFEGHFYGTAPPPSIWLEDSKGNPKLWVVYGRYMSLSKDKTRNQVDVIWSFSKEGKLTEVSIRRWETDLAGLFNFEFN